MDPAEYAAALETLLGDGLYETIAKFSPGGSELHGGKEKKPSKVGYQAALAGNALATVGGAHALTMAAKEMKNSGQAAPGRHKAAPKVNATLKKLPGGQKIGEAGIKAGKWIEAHPRAGLAVAGGWVGLHGAELAADAYANHAIRQNYKRATESNKSVHKSIDPRKKLYDPEVQGLPMPISGQFVRLAANNGPAILRATKKGAEVTGRVAEPVARKTSTKVKEKIEERRLSKAEPTDVDFEVTWETEISKMDVDKRQVFGWASVVEKDGEPVVDLQGDYISPEEMEKAAYTYVQKSRKGGDMHRRNGDEAHHVSDMIESFIVTPEKIEKMGLPAGSLPTGWWTGFQIHDDDTWNLVKSGKRTAFSIHGRGKRTAV